VRVVPLECATFIPRDCVVIRSEPFDKLLRANGFVDFPFMLRISKHSQALPY
jgi:hypothetical protein